MHKSIFGIIPTQRQLAKRLLAKIKKRVIVRKVGWNQKRVQVQSYEDKKKQKILNKFLKQEKFDDKNTLLESVVPRNTPWLDDDDYYQQYSESEHNVKEIDKELNNEINILNHAYFDKMHHDILMRDFKNHRAHHHHHHHHHDHDEGGLTGIFSSCFAKEEKHECSSHKNRIIVDKYTIT